MDLPGMPVLLGSVALPLAGSVVPGFVGKGSSATVVVVVIGFVVGFVPVAVLPVFLQPAKRVAVRTRISTMMLAFFILNPPDFANAKLLSHHAAFLLWKILTNKRK